MANDQVVVCVSYKDIPVFAEAVMCDVDGSGGFLQTESPLPVGTLLSLRPTRNPSLHIPARVALVVESCRGTRSAENDIPGMNLTFEAAGEYLLDYLEEGPIIVPAPILSPPPPRSTPLIAPLEPITRPAASPTVSSTSTSNAPPPPPSPLRSITGPNAPISFLAPPPLPATAMGPDNLEEEDPTLVEPRMVVEVPLEDVSGERTSSGRSAPEPQVEEARVVVAEEFRIAAEGLQTAAGRATMDPPMGVTPGAVTIKLPAGETPPSLIEENEADDDSVIVEMEADYEQPVAGDGSAEDGAEGETDPPVNPADTDEESTRKNRRRGRRRKKR